MARNKNSSNESKNPITFNISEDMNKKDKVANIDKSKEELLREIEHQKIIIQSLLLSIKHLQGDNKTFPPEILSLFENNSFNTTKSNASPMKLSLDCFDDVKKTKIMPKEELSALKDSNNITKNINVTNKEESPITSISKKAKRTGEKCTKEEIKQLEEQNNKILNNINSSIITSDEPTTKFTELGITDISADIKHCTTKIKTTNKVVEFRENFSVDEFVKFVSVNYEYKFNDKRKNNRKGGQKTYVDTNLTEIISHLLKNINTLSLREITTTLFMITNEISRNHKQIIAMDIVLLIKERSKLIYIISALFNNSINSNIINNVLIKTIVSICAYQYNIEVDLYGDDSTIMKYLGQIKNNFDNFNLEKVDLHELLDELLMFKSSSIINYESNSIDYNANIHAWSIRMSCHIFDWSYTYNNVVVDRLNIKENIFHALVSIYLCIDAYYKFNGNVKDLGYSADSGVNALISELIYIMNDASETSQLIYAFIRTVDEEKAEEYMEFYRTALGFERVYKLSRMRIF